MTGKREERRQAKWDQRTGEMLDRARQVAAETREVDAQLQTALPPRRLWNDVIWGVVIVGLTVGLAWLSFCLLARAANWGRREWREWRQQTATRAIVNAVREPASRGSVDDALLAWKASSKLYPKYSRMAIDRLKKKVADNPGDLEANASLGIISYSENRWDDVHTHLLLAARSAAGDQNSVAAGRRLEAFSWHSLALFQQQEGHRLLACQYWRRTVSLQPGDPYYRYELAKALWTPEASADELLEAEQTVQEAVHLEGPTAENQLLLARILRDRAALGEEVKPGQVVEVAEEAFRLARQSSPVDEDLANQCEQTLEAAQQGK